MMMANAGVDMPGPGAGGEGDHPAAASSASKCRLRRRRRLAPRRRDVLQEEGDQDAVSAPAGGENRGRHHAPSSSSSSEGGSEGFSDGGEEDPAATAASVVAAAAPLPEESATAPEVWPVAFGSVALAGRLREMEDTVSLHPSFCVWADGSAMHFFAVFDGHGGPHVSALCREQMHVVMAEELAAEAARLHGAAAAAGHEEEQAWQSALSRSFARVDALAAEVCACGNAAPCDCPLSENTRGAIIGSTAVVALLIRDRLIVANCGDSRAVLCRAGAGAVPLSCDQKPDRPDEKARIEAAGGQVVYLGGARVRGILAMSRALGHKFLKPEVICEPEITITARIGEDDCLILASDGMWDVISNETACAVAQQCLEDGSPTVAAGSGEAASGSSNSVFEAAAAGQQSEPRCNRTAALLARLALGRESSDNISVIVIDLKSRG